MTAISGARRSWHAMRGRCLTKSSGDYPLYGGRGITVDPRWNTFEAFLADMGERPPGHSLDRIDFNGPYTKANCRWATAETQSRNRRSSALLSLKGETKTLAEWVLDTGLSHATLRKRISMGWSAERVLTEPVHENMRRAPRCSASMKTNNS